MLTPRVSSYRVAVVTPVTCGLVEPLLEDLGAQTIADPEPLPHLDDEPPAVREARGA